MRTTFDIEDDVLTAAKELARRQGTSAGGSCQERCHPLEAFYASLAKVHQLTVVTRNVTDFHRFEVPLLNPFTR